MLKNDLDVWHVSNSHSVKLNYRNCVFYSRFAIHYIELHKYSIDFDSMNFDKDRLIHNTVRIFFNIGNI